MSNVDKKTAEGQVPVRLCNYTDVYYGDRISPALDLMTASATPEQLRAFRLQAGDVIITKDSEDPWDIAVPAFVSESASDLVCGYHLAVLRPKVDQLDGRYLYWAMSSRPVSDFLSLRATGITRFGLRTDSIASTPLPWWSVARQRAIADFLDAETARIDAVITKKRRLSARLDDRWHAELRSCLRIEGVDPESGVVAAPLPPGWSVRPLRRLVDRVWGGDWGSEAGEDEIDASCVRAADFDFRRIQADGGAIRSFSHTGLAARGLSDGDLVIEKSGGGEGVPVGRVVAWQGPLPAVPTNFAGGLRPSKDASSDFVLLAFRAAYDIGLPWRSIKQTTGLQNLDLSHYLTHAWPVPPIEEQRVIAADLMGSLDRTRGVQALLADQVVRLVERRQALITAAVTGELDIAGVAA